MAGTTYLPLAWKNLDFTSPNDVQIFQKQISDWANQVQNIVGSASGLAGVLNGSNALQPSSLFIISKDFGVVSSNQTQDCSGASMVSLSLQINTAVAITLTLNNLTPGVPVGIRFNNNQGTAEFFKIVANTPASVAYTVVGIRSTDAAVINLTTTGANVTGNSQFAFSWAGSVASPVLTFLFG